MADKIKKNRRFLIISNIVIAVVCVVAMAGFFIMPAGQVKLSFKIDRNYLTSVRESIKGTGKDQGTVSRNISNDEIWTGAMSNGSGRSDIESDIEGALRSTLESMAQDIGPDVLIDALIDELGDRSMYFSAGVGVSTPKLLSCVGATDEQAVGGLVRENLDGIVDDALVQLDDAKEILVGATGRVVKAVSAIALQAGFDEVKAIISERSGTEGQKEFDDFSERVGLNSEAIEEQVAEIIDTLTDEGMTSAEIADEAAKIYINIYEQAKVDPKYGSDVLNEYEYDPEGFRDGVKNWLDSTGLEGEDGKINIELLINEVLVSGILEMLPEAAGLEEQLADSGISVSYEPVITFKGTKGTGTGATTSAAVPSIPSTSSFDDPQVRADLKAKIASVVDKMLESSSVQKLFRPAHIVLIIIAAISLIHILAWLYLLIKIIAKTGRPNPGVTLWVPIVFGWSFLSLITLIPAIRLNFQGAKRIFGIPINDVPAAVPDMLLKVITGGVIAALCGISLFIFAFIYSHYRRELNQELAVEKEKKENA